MTITTDDAIELPDPTVFGPPLSDAAPVRAEPDFRLKCEQCGPLDGSQHDNAMERQARWDAHTQAHREGVFT